MLNLCTLNIDSRVLETCLAQRYCFFFEVLGSQSVKTGFTVFDYLL